MTDNTYSPKFLFFNGFFYAFGLVSNPITKILNNRKKVTDLDNIESDWVKIGNDIKKIYGQEISNIG